MDTTIKILQLILSLAILVLLHEFGHFAFAKLFKTRVEKFYLFFNPWFSVFKFKKGETEYGLGWLPLGGYVKISGMIDESMDKEQMKLPPQPWEFRSKPAYQRLLIMLGGVLVNFILAMFIYAMSLFVWGEEYVPMKEATYGVYCSDVAEQLGIVNGDKILMVDTFLVDKISDVPMRILLNDAETLTLERNGEVIVLPIPKDYDQDMMKEIKDGFIEFLYPFVIAPALENSRETKLGLKEDDRIVAVNGIESPFFQDYEKIISELLKKNDEQGEAKADSIPISLKVQRNNSFLDLSVSLSNRGLMGVSHKTPMSLFKTVKKEYGFLESFPAGISKGFSTLAGYVKQFKLVFTKEGVKQLGGFGTIGNLFPSTWNWQIFWGMTAFLSVILAFMNILPIPALDGGHVLFLLYEMISGRKPSEKFMEKAQIVGMVILVALLLYANGNDFVGCVRENF